jgi:hypothetical protein
MLVSGMPSAAMTVNPTEGTPCTAGAIKSTGGTYRNSCQNASRS